MYMYMYTCTLKIEHKNKFVRHAEAGQNDAILKELFAQQ